MNVLQVVSHGVGRAGERGVGGPEKRALESLKLLDRDRFTPVIAYSKGGVLNDAFRETGVRLAGISMRGIEDLGAGRRLLEIIRSERIDIVHTQGPLAYDFYASRAAAATGIPHIVTRPALIEDYRCSRATRWAYGLVDRTTLARAFRVVAVSEDGRRRMARLPGVDPGKVVLVRNGVDVGLYRPDPDARSRLLSELVSTGIVEAGVTGERDAATPLIGMAAQLVDDKGWDDFLRVSGAVASHFPHALAFVVGSGPMLGELREMVRTMGVGGSVAFLGLRRDVERVLPALDVFLLTSRREGLPVSIIEAMACGRPVVTTDAGGSPELIVPGETGYVVPVGDWQGAADHVITLLTDCDLRSRMGATAREKAVAAFSLERMVAEYEAIYDDALRGPPRGRPDRSAPRRAAGSVGDE